MEYSDYKLKFDEEYSYTIVSVDHQQDRKSTRLNSAHSELVCRLLLEKKKKKKKTKRKNKEKKRKKKQEKKERNTQVSERHLKDSIDT